MSEIAGLHSSLVSCRETLYDTLRRAEKAEADLAAERALRRTAANIEREAVKLRADLVAARAEIERQQQLIWEQDAAVIERDNRIRSGEELLAEEIAAQDKAHAEYEESVAALRAQASAATRLLDVATEALAKVARGAHASNAVYALEAIRAAQTGVHDPGAERTDSFGTCTRCGYRGPGPKHDCKAATP